MDRRGAMQQGYGATQQGGLTTGQAIYGVLGLAGTVLGAYHGYKRNDSVGWAIGWALLGGAFPFITLPVSYAQGFAERKKG